MPGTKMVFAGMKQPGQIADLIAYLKGSDEVVSAHDRADQRLHELVDDDLADVPFLPIEPQRGSDCDSP